jgi:hypothetical protein
VKRCMVLKGEGEGDTKCELLMVGFTAKYTSAQEPVLLAQYCSFEPRPRRTSSFFISFLLYLNASLVYFSCMAEITRPIM